MEINTLLANLKGAIERNGSPTGVRNAVEAVLVWLNEPSHNTNENCQAISRFMTTQLNFDEIDRLPSPLRDILFDMGATLDDTYTSPQVADNFESKPDQLLRRVRKLRF